MACKKKVENLISSFINYCKSKRTRRMMIGLEELKVQRQPPEVFYEKKCS